MALLAALVFAALLLPGGAEFAVSITSDPSTGPFIREFLNPTNVSFHCSVDPLPPEPVTYRWRTTDPEIGDASGQNLSFATVHRMRHFSWLFCEVLSNGSSVGNASTFIEFQGRVIFVLVRIMMFCFAGFLSTQEPQARCFTIGDAISLRVDVRLLDIRLGMVTWFHNGTEVESGDRATVNYINPAIPIFHTDLTIHSAIPADAGVYQVKVTKFVLIPESSYNEMCEALWLPLLQNHAGYTSTTFMLSECTGQIQYDIEKAGDVRSHYITNDGVEPQIAMNLDTSLVVDPFLTYSNISWFHNGAPVDADRVVGTASYQPGSINVTLTVHNATAEDTGVYEGTADAYQPTIRANSNNSICNVSLYGNYAAILLLEVQMVYLSIIVDHLYVPPIASVSARSPSLLARETTLLTCRAEGGNPNTHTLTWSKGNAVLATGTSTLSVSSLANTFGEYVCSVQTVVGSNTAIKDLNLLLKEKSPMQLKITPEVQCTAWQESTAISDVVLAVQDVIHSLCNCSVDPTHLQNVTPTCSASGSSVIISASLSYSDTRGVVTASDLIASLQTWLLTASQPAITIAGESYSLSRTCPADSNLETFNACFNELISSTSSSSGALTGLFMGGLCAGLILAVMAFGICVFLKVRQSTDMHDVSGKQTENKDVRVSENAAYKMVPNQTRQAMVISQDPENEVRVSENAAYKMVPNQTRQTMDEVRVSENAAYKMVPNQTRQTMVASQEPEYEVCD